MEKYQIYRNDIKYRKHKNIDPDKAIWDDGIKHDYHNKETDSLEYRIQECVRENYDSLDLSHMHSLNNTIINNLIDDQTFSDIMKKIKHLFINNNGMYSLPDLRYFTSLETLDISHNNLEELPNLPDTLEELVFNDNQISSVDIVLPKLKRLNAANNKISKINFPEKLESLYLNDNPISCEISRLDKLNYLDISKTRIYKINILPKVRYLDCSFTKIIKLPRLDNLEELVCNDTLIEDINVSDKLMTLNICRTKVNKISFIKPLQTLIYDDEKIVLSQSYKIRQVLKNRNNIYNISFNKN